MDQATPPPPPVQSTPTADQPVAAAPAVEAPVETAPTAEPSEQTVDMVTAPEQTAEEVAESTPATVDQQAPVDAEPTKSKPAVDADTKLAIIATVIIVIALAGLATAAFLMQK